MGAIAATNKTSAAQLRKLAESLAAMAEDKQRDLSQNPTPKRMKEYRSRCIDGRAAERAAIVASALAEMEEHPGPIADAKITKAALVYAMSKRTGSNGYYDIHETDEWRDNSPLAVALRAVLDMATDPEEARRKAEARQLEEKLNALRISDIPGFFPTPPVIIEAMREEIAAHLDGCDGPAWMLEPSAGAGHVADMMAQEIDKHTPGGTLHCVELYRALREVLTLKGHEVIADDFAEMDTALYDVIAMNPPFEKDAAIGHVFKAASMLRPGGLLLAVIPAGLERGGSSAKRTGFSEWLEESAEIVGRYDDAFKGPDSFRSTGVATILIKHVNHA